MARDRAARPAADHCQAAEQDNGLERWPGAIHGLGVCEEVALRAFTRDSSFLAASESFSDTSRKNCAVRFSVSGATSSSTYVRRRPNSASKRRPSSSNFSMGSLRQIVRRDSGIIETQKQACKEE